MSMPYIIGVIPILLLLLAGIWSIHAIQPALNNNKNAVDTASSWGNPLQTPPYNKPDHAGIDERLITIPSDSFRISVIKPTVSRLPSFFNRESYKARYKKLLCWIKESRDKVNLLAKNTLVKSLNLLTRKTTKEKPAGMHFSPDPFLRYDAKRWGQEIAIIVQTMTEGSFAGDVTYVKTEDYHRDQEVACHPPVKNSENIEEQDKILRRISEDVLVRKQWNKKDEENETAWNNKRTDSRGLGNRRNSNMAGKDEAFSTQKKSDHARSTGNIRFYFYAE